MGQSLESVLLRNALENNESAPMTQTAGEVSIRTKWETFVAEIPYFYLSVILWLLASCFYWVPKLSYLTIHCPWLAGFVVPSVKLL